MEWESAIPGLRKSQKRNCKVRGQVNDLNAAGRATWSSAESYWQPSRIVVSAWLEHAPFAFWIMKAIKPALFVELGTHNGFSFYTFCEAATRLGLETHCVAIDTWRGDDHAGFYGDEIFQDVSAVKLQYGDKAELLRGYFDDFVGNFADASIDLLHIDGRHGYDDVKHDFESWLPKLSARGVVLFHDIAEREHGFGVWQLWEEVSGKYASFAFEHGHGLGIIAVGTDVPAGLREILSMTEESASEVRKFYAEQGKVISARFQHDADMEARLADTEARLADAETRVAETETRLAETEARLVGVEAEKAELRSSIEAVRAELDSVLGSSSWQITRPLRAVAAAIPAPARRGIRRRLERLREVFRR